MPVLGQVPQWPVEPRLVAESADLKSLHQNPPAARSDGRGVQLRRGVQDRSTSMQLKKDIEQVMTTSQDWWPADYGHYGPLLHPDGVAQRRHLPHPRRPRRRRRRRAALRAAQQLARQRQPRQGAPAALADQEEVRPEALVGRPDGPRRQLRARVDGVQDVRLRRRARGRLGADGGQLGHRGHVAG